MTDGLIPAILPLLALQVTQVASQNELIIYDGGKVAKPSLHYSCDFCGTFMKRAAEGMVDDKEAWACRNPRCEGAGVIVYPQLLPSNKPTGGTTKVIRGLDPVLYKEFRIVALQKGCTVGELLNDAMMIRIGQDAEEG